MKHSNPYKTIGKNTSRLDVLRTKQLTSRVNPKSRIHLRASNQLKSLFQNDYLSKIKSECDKELKLHFELIVETLNSRGIA